MNISNAEFSKIIPNIEISDASPIKRNLEDVKE
jgi:hypothetical protein